jgi:hypothetical protein
MISFVNTCFTSFQSFTTLVFCLVDLHRKLSDELFFKFRMTADKINMKLLWLMKTSQPYSDWWWNVQSFKPETKQNTSWDSTMLRKANDVGFENIMETSSSLFCKKKPWTILNSTITDCINYRPYPEDYPGKHGKDILQQHKGCQRE